jgi:putative YphP/YqiW family bacilliredoxin
MMYPIELTTPFSKELTDFGFEGLTTAADVDNVLANEKGPLLLVVNSVCGCAAGNARPGVKLAVQHSEKKPARLVTVFAGVDKEATEKAREYLLPYPPSSPAIALFNNGELVHMIERRHIEGNNAQTIANHLINVFDEVLQ